MLKNQKGFAPIESLLILIVVGILAGTCWYVLDSRKKIDKSLASAAKTSASSKTPAKASTKAVDSSITASWPVYKDTVNDFSFSYPPSWKATPTSYSQQTINITSPDIKEEEVQPFGGTKVTAGSKISLIFTAQTHKTLDQIFSSSFQANSSNKIQKDSRQIDGVPAYEFEFGSENGSINRNIIFVKGTQYSIIAQLSATDVSKISPGYDTFIKILDSVVVK